MSVITHTSSQYSLKPPRSGARNLSRSDRQEIAMDAICKQAPITRIAEEYDVSRKFVYEQKSKALHAVEEEFKNDTDIQDQVLFHIPITKALIQRLVLALILICHSSYRGVCEILKELFNYDISIGTVHNIVSAAMHSASTHNAEEDLKNIRVGAHDEIFQNRSPVLVGCDAHSTYCYLLESSKSRDADSWGIALLEAEEKGLQPDYTVGDGGTGLRAGQALVWPKTPCFGDVFHALHDFGKLRVFLENRAYGAISALDKLEHKMLKAKNKKRGNKHSRKLGALRQGLDQALALSDDVSTLCEWLQEDILSIAGPPVEERKELLRFVIDELKNRESQAPHRIRPLRKKLENQMNNLLQFAERIDASIDVVAEEFEVDPYFVRLVFDLESRKLSQQERLELENRARAYLRGRFYGVQKMLKELLDLIVRASSIVENLNSRLRNYFFLRKQLGSGYLELLRFYLNHRRFQRSEHPCREGKSPRELMTGKSHEHWLDLLVA